MTHSNHRFTTLSADDVALCRAHSEAIDDDRESRWLQRWADAVAPLVTPLMSVRAFEVGNHMPVDLPMPPSYWDDLEHWLKTLAPAKPTAPQPVASQPASAWRSGTTIPKSERVGLWHVHLGDNRGSVAKGADELYFDFADYRPAAPGVKHGDPYDESKYTAPAQQPEPSAEMWHSEAPSVAGVYVTRPESCDAAKARLRWWDGIAWHMNHGSTTASIDEVRRTGVRNGSLYGPLLWLRLIEADKPAQQPAQKASTHLVCIEQHSCKVTGKKIPVGHVSVLTEKQRPDCWLPCDESGWMTHVPTADAVCPVPDGVGHETKRRCGDIVGSDCSTSLAWQLGHEERRVPHEYDIIAWRPIAQS